MFPQQGGTVSSMLIESSLNTIALKAIAETHKITQKKYYKPYIFLISRRGKENFIRKGFI